MLKAQRTPSIYSGNGLWNDAANWSSGIPDSTTPVEIFSASSVDVQAMARCEDLFLSLGSLNISNGGVLDVSGEFINDGGSFSIMPGGRFIIRGGILSPSFNRHVEVASSIELTSSIEVDQTFNSGGFD